MSNTLIEQLEDLDFVIQDYIYLSGRKGVDTEKEIYNNYWEIMFSQKLVKEMTLFDLQEFIYKLFSKREQQVKELGITSPITFYMWFNQIGQLCFNLLSGENINLPFRCTLKYIDSADVVLKKFLEEEKKAAEKGGHLLFEDMVILKPGDEGFGEIEEEDPLSFTQEVYATTIS